MMTPISATAEGSVKEDESGIPYGSWSQHQTVKLGEAAHWKIMQVQLAADVALYLSQNRGLLDDEAEVSCHGIEATPSKQCTATA